MPLWRVSFESKTKTDRHHLKGGFGHALMVSIVSETFRDLRVSASVYDGKYRWRSLHEVPGSNPFELEHGVEAERHAYNRRSIAQVRRRREALIGSHAGQHDLFVPIVARGQLAAILVVGPFRSSRATSADVLEGWRWLTGRHGHTSEPEFAAYLSTVLGLLVLDDAGRRSLTEVVTCLATLMAGEGDAQALANRAEMLRAKLLPCRMVERSWETVRAMLDERSASGWSSKHRSWERSLLGLSQDPDRVLVGLAVGEKGIDSVEEAIRRDAFQRSAVELARSTGDVVAGQVGENGVVFLMAAREKAKGERRLRDFAERAASLARRFELTVHFGAAAVGEAADPTGAYQAALGAAEVALMQEQRFLVAEAAAGPPTPSLRHLREELAASVEQHPDTLEARFDRYLEAVALHSGHRVEVARPHLEVGFEWMAKGLVESGALDRQSHRALLGHLDQVGARARTTQDLFAAYRRAAADVGDSMKAPVPARQDRSLRRATEYIQQHFAEPLRVAKVARLSGFTPNYFSELFHRRERLTFEQYVRKLRIERARELLSNTKLEAARIAELCGFGSPQYFGRVFKAALGVTPMAYRERPTRRNRTSVSAGKSPSRSPRKLTSRTD